MAEPIIIILTEELKKWYQELPAPIQKKFQKQLRFLQTDPKHPSLRIHRLNDESGGTHPKPPSTSSGQALPGWECSGVAAKKRSCAREITAERPRQLVVSAC